ncbi:hypothetical protein FA95DRAFT_1495134 [Auriscalpium vulgare]|uniref:Uncharacterized protein n=1 Tax=Auriscalpium vulgare TaxID=40419 RepID=A0ACB8RQ46_9AGAM|nr:hypothetical protein FA95DRAFT_1495134 [Auriscalpium vulgare]
MASTSLRRASQRLRPQLLPTRSISTSSSTASTPIRTGAYATLFAVSTGLLAVYYFDSRALIHRYFITPAVRYGLDTETGHKLAVQVLGSGLGPKDRVLDDERLKTELWGTTLANPVGVAAGFDKDGEAIDGLFDLGFSWVEIGSITPKPQPGNPRPRVFRLPDDSALINRYGFPSQGHTSVIARLRARLPTFPSPAQSAAASLHPNKLLAVNLGKNKESAPDSPDDFVAGVRAFAPYADVLVVNVSSPNTPGLRGLQQRDLLVKLLSSVTAARDEFAASSSHRPKLVLKIAPDLTSHELEDIADAITETGGVDGVIVSNTTTQRPAHLRHPDKVQQGGLSGTPLYPLSLAAVRTLRTHLPASVPLIGCGGIGSGADALAFARAGASFVQVYTAFGYDGPGTCRRIKDEIAAELAREGTTWGEVVKRAVGELSAQDGRVRGKEKEDGVKQLIKQAEELKGLLDQLGEKLGVEEKAAA